MKTYTVTQAENGWSVGWRDPVTGHRLQIFTGAYQLYDFFTNQEKLNAKTEPPIEAAPSNDLEDDILF